jgi:phosphoribosylamine--glycine ligase
MKILVIGGGGREHALVWRLKQSRQVERVWCAPGNGGIAEDAECIAADVKDVAGLAALAGQLKPDVTVVGPELPLVLGVVDALRERGLKVVGPHKAAARLEGSKVFAKEFLERHAIPTAPLYGIHDSPGAAYSALCAVDWPVVIKADGLCAGKGVMVAESPDEATPFIERLMDKREFGEAGARVVLEEALVGEELSYIVLTDGENVLPMLPTQDHKRALDGDRGPNTGGMGAYSMDGLVSAEIEAAILESIVRPTLVGMAAEGHPYQGFLYFGLMLTAEGPRVLEFNCRMGDPETQAILIRMTTDFAEVCAAAAEGRLKEMRFDWRPGASVCVVMASGGYPGKYSVGAKISGLEKELPEGSKIFHAGTKREGPDYYTSGGRVLAVTASGSSLSEASSRAYRICSGISFAAAHYRKDIGARALARAQGGD